MLLRYEAGLVRVVRLWSVCATRRFKAFVLCTAPILSTRPRGASRYLLPGSAVAAPRRDCAACEKTVVVWWTTALPLCTADADDSRVARAVK